MTAELHCYDYVNRPFDRVRAALGSDTLGLFERATQSAAGRARTLVSHLHVTVAGLEVGKDVVVRLLGTQTAEAPGRVGPKALRLDLAWEAESNASLFPSMRASLLVYPLSPTETQLDLRGTYEPPGGVLGSAADRLVGHRIAEAAVHRLLADLASRLGQELA
jgi:hypothetical protein